MNLAWIEDVLHGSEIFRTLSDCPWGPPNLLYNGNQSIQVVKRPRRGIDDQPPSSAEVKKRLDLYIHSLSGTSWSFQGEFTIIIIIIIIIII